MRCAVASEGVAGAGVAEGDEEEGGGHPRGGGGGQDGGRGGVELGRGGGAGGGRETRFVRL